MIFTVITLSLFLILAILVAGWYHFKYRPQQYTKRLIAEGASILPASTNQFDDLDSIKKGVQANPDMKAFVIEFPGSAFLFVTDTELIKEVLTNHHYYTKMGKGFELNRVFNSRGLSASEGDAWKLHRRVLSEAFQYDLFNDMVPTILEATDEVIGIASKQKKTIQAPRDIELITSDVITRIFFGIRSRDVMINGLRACDEVSEIVEKMKKYRMSIIRFVLGDWALNFHSEYRDVKKRMRTFRKIFGKKIHERMEEIKAEAPSASKKRDFLHILLQQRAKYNNDPAQTFSDEEILDEFSSFFLAGKDTTSLLVSMALHSFVTFPEWRDKILEEINEKIKDTSQINIEVLNSMNNLTAFISEVLRFYPPAPSIIPRLANRDHYLGNFFVKKGFAIGTMFFSNHFNSKYFDDPEKFDPNRWLKDENQTRNEGWKSNPFAYIPFSAGPRNCIGKQLGLIEAKIILISILQSYQVALEPEFKLHVSQSGIGFGPKNPIPLILTPK